MLDPLQTALYIGVGGFLGANARHWLFQWSFQVAGARFPWGTLLVNISGSFGLALLLGYIGRHAALDPRWRLMIAVGFFGAYTTFSTFASDSVLLARSEQWPAAIANVIGTNVLCLVAAGVGMVLGERL